MTGYRFFLFPLQCCPPCFPPPFPPDTKRVCCTGVAIECSSVNEALPLPGRVGFDEIHQNGTKKEGASHGQLRLSVMPFSVQAHQDGTDRGRDVSLCHTLRHPVVASRKDGNIACLVHFTRLRSVCVFVVLDSSLYGSLCFLLRSIANRTAAASSAFPHFHQPSMTD